MCMLQQGWQERLGLSNDCQSGRILGSWLKNNNNYDVVCVRVSMSVSVSVCVYVYVYKYNIIMQTVDYTTSYYYSGTSCTYVQ